MSELLNSKGFNDWADGYDRSTARSDEDGSYPFAGYNDILNEIFRRITERGEKDVLDIGFGTGVLTARLYAHDCRILGQDFSERIDRSGAGKDAGGDADLRRFYPRSRRGAEGAAV